MTVASATAPRERPIIMSDPMILAILAGRKTETRRIVRPAPLDDAEHLVEIVSGGRVHYRRPAEHEDVSEARRTPGYSVRPYLDALNDAGPCRAGDLLWVRESHVFASAAEAERWGGPSDPARPGRVVVYRAGWPYAHAPGAGRWRSSIHLPRWAARLTLRVVSTRVERLHAITVTGAHREGVAGSPGCWMNYEHPAGAFANPIDSYRTLWEKIHGRGTWAKNPLVRVVTFERVAEAA